jgi:hypothetical protein
VTRRSAEVRVLASMGVFGLVIGTVYWFLTYEIAGTLLLVGFGLAAGIAAAVIVERSGREPEAPADGAPAFPHPGWAPIGIGAGIGGVALGAVFGPWLAIAGIMLAVVGGWVWLTTAMDESDPHREARPRDD